jgi:hypothetical protein
VGRLVEQQPSAQWEAWYGFARSELGLSHVEAVEYANLPLVEDENRRVLRDASREATHQEPPL